MLSRSIKNLIQLTAARNCFAFSTHDEPTPTKLGKVKDIVVNIYVKNKYGVVETVPAFVGESLLDAISRMKVHAFKDGHCNGYDFTYRPHIRPHDNDTEGPNCGHCVVVLQDNWFKRVHEQTDGYNNNEEVLLNSILHVKSNSRLACCIPIESWMQGMTLAVDVTPSEGEQTMLI